MKIHAVLFSYVFQNETEHSAFLLNIRFISLQNKYIFKNIFERVDGSGIPIEATAFIFPQNLNINIKHEWNQ